MPGRKSKTNTTTTAKNATSTVTWKRITLDDTDIAFAVELASNANAIYGRIGNTLAEGWGFSVKYDATRKNYTCFIISPENTENGSQVGISAYAPNALSAAAACYAKWDKYAANPDTYANNSAGVGIG